ncbi:hypothetical protein EKH55_5923 (plasmid) [Sinorhizobium alkalisoli]|nr:hypothetical protein EKH55_5923 [Sinorhizobium alkalisoli]
MWQWEDKSPTRQPTSAATPYAEIQNQAAPAAFEQFDIAGSYRNCGKE